MTWRWTVPLGGLFLAGCLASKGDIRLLQDEFRATRAQLGIVDTSIARANEQRRQQIANLSAAVDRLAAALERQSDSLRALAARFQTAQAMTSGELNIISGQVDRLREMLGATTRALQDTRSQFEQLRDQTAAAPPTNVPPAPGAPPAGTPGPATLFQAGFDALREGANSTARRSFEDLLTAWPRADQAPRALLFIGESYANEQNKTAADSVYQLVAVRYPKSDAAATSLFRHAQLQYERKETAETRTTLERIIKEYPNSDAAPLARDLLSRIR